MNDQTTDTLHILAPGEMAETGQGKVGWEKSCEEPASVHPRPRLALWRTPGAACRQCWRNPGCRKMPGAAGLMALYEQKEFPPGGQLSRHFLRRRFPGR